MLLNGVKQQLLNETFQYSTITHTLKETMLTRLSKFLSEFPQLEGFGLITHVNIHPHMQVLTLQV